MNGSSKSNDHSNENKSVNFFTGSVSVVLLHNTFYRKVSVVGFVYDEENSIPMTFEIYLFQS